MKELLLIYGCFCLAFIAVALLGWWVRDECRDTPIVKLLTRRMKGYQRVTFMEAAGLPTVAPAPKPELASSVLPVPLLP